MNWLSASTWLALLIAVVGAGGLGYLRGYSNGGDDVQHEWNEARAVADRAAVALERRRQLQADEAQRVARNREAVIRRDVALARGDVDGLRDNLDAVERFAASSDNAARVAVAALGNVFESCVREYQGLAEVADGHASDSLMLQQAWPRE